MNNHQTKINPWNIKHQRHDKGDVKHDYVITFDDKPVAAVSVKEIKDNRTYMVSKIDDTFGMTEFNKNWLDVVLESVIQIDEYLHCDNMPYKLVELMSLLKLMPDKNSIDKSDILESSKTLIPPFLVERRKSVKTLPEFMDGDRVQNKSSCRALS